MANSRLLWRCRRGIREMDIVLRDFLTCVYDDLPEPDQRRFRALLDESDLDILNWLMGKEQPASAELQRIIALLRQARDSG